MSENLDPFKISQNQLSDACKILGYGNDIYNALSVPERFFEIKLTMKMDDGSIQTFRKGDIMMLPRGHDAWTIGDEDFEFIQMSQGDTYYDDRVRNFSLA